MNVKETSHPAYGMAQFKRIHGNSGHLFGASVECNDYIELSIMAGVEVETDINHCFSRDYNKPTYITVKLSPAQFAELLTTMNVNDGVPCTIKSINDKSVEKIPDEIHEHELDRQKRKFNETMKNIETDLKEKKKRVDELLKQPRLNKEEKEELSNILNKSITSICSNIPFYMEQFQEGTDNIVKEAKANIDATVQTFVTNTGIKVLGEEFKKIDKK